ncbi:MAG TPA: ADP-glyceromanno-heptose 6-epimerase [Bacteroidales bacterium]|nr:ADP-glyceromanno-heptose 6-epimerase [Bacteroidales bacterium]
MIVLTGAAGFIGSNILTGLNQANYKDIILVDDFSDPGKSRNYESKEYTAKVDRQAFIPWLAENHMHVQIVLHMGARTDTAEFNWDTFLALNVHYSQEVWKCCVEYGIPLIYASSAATYGLGEHGFDDNHEIVSKLKPLNPYGRSKNDFDKWVVNQLRAPFFWAGLKFFNVYGPNEYHKGRMASVVYHAFNQIQETEKMKLFRSHHPDFKDGEQMRDFIYVKDVVDVVIFLMEERPFSGLFNLGTGRAETFLHLVEGVFRGLDKEPEISYIDTPEDIRDKYQYYTRAEMDKLFEAGYGNRFRPLSEGVEEYVRQYLTRNRIN